MITISRVEIISLFVASSIIAIGLFVNLYSNTLIDLYLRCGCIVVGNNIVIFIGYKNTKRINHFTVTTLKVFILFTIMESITAFVLAYNVYEEFLYEIFITGITVSIALFYSLREHNFPFILALVNFLSCLEMVLNLTWSCFSLLILFRATKYYFGGHFGLSIKILGVSTLAIHYIITMGVSYMIVTLSQLYRYSPISDAFSCCRTGNIEKLKRLKNDGLKLNEIRAKFSHDSCLAIACESGHLEIVKFLLEGIGIKKKGVSQWGLYQAYKKKHFDVVKYLLENGCLINKTKPNEILIKACKYGHLELIEYLVNEKESSLQTRNKHGTCLINAAMNKHVDCVVWMLNNGSSLSERVEPKRGKFASTILQENGIYEQVKRIMTQKSSRK